MYMVSKWCAGALITTRCFAPALNLRGASDVISGAQCGSNADCVSPPLLSPLQLAAESK